MKHFIIAIFAALLLTSSTRAQSEALPTLRGAEAVNQLKETGGYDSLINAVGKARLKNSQTTAPSSDAAAAGQTAKLVASDGETNDQFGNSVAISGDAAIVGAAIDDVGTNNDQGSAYVFLRSGATWTQQPRLNASDSAADDHFGNSVAVGNGTAIVGSPFADISAAAFADDARQASFNTNDASFAGANQGAAYIFTIGFPPTAASVSVTGRVTTAAGKGLANAVVTLTDAGGVAQSTRTARDGGYRFDDVRAGETYIAAAKAKRYRFDSTIVTPNEDLNGLDFTALP